MMRVDIEEILEVGAGRICFRCEVGSGVGYWKGREAVRTGSFDVEFEISDEVSNWTVVDNLMASIGRITCDDNLVQITGEVLRVDDDDVVHLKVDTDVLLVEIPRASSRITERQIISFSVEELLLYPYAL